MRNFTRVILCTLVLLGATLFPGCSGGAEMAKTGDTVQVHYTGTLNDGSVFDSSLNRDPLEFRLGQGMVIPGFDAAVTGMKIGESKTVTIPAEQAYGEHDENHIFEIGNSQLPPGLNPQPGQQLQMRSGDGQTMIVTVVSVSQEFITVDANHPLAGKDLTFELKLVAIK